MITIKQEQFYYRVPDKDGNPGDFKSFNVAGERRLSELKKEIEEKVDDYMDVYLEEFKKTIVNLEDNKVDKITTINGKDLSDDRILYMNDIPVSTSDSRGTKTYTDKIVNDEAARATKKEGELSTAISAETTRATEAETTLQTNKADKATTINGYDLSENRTLRMEDIPVVYGEKTINAKEYADSVANDVKKELLGDNAVEQLNTLTELGKALNDDENFATTVTNLISNNKTAIEKEVARATEKEGLIDKDIEDIFKTIDEHKVRMDYGAIPVVNASSDDGITYVATIENITELKTGQIITIIPNKTSSSYIPVLNLNSLGDRQIVFCSSNATPVKPAKSDYITANAPVILQYNGSNWVVITINRPHLNECLDTLQMSKGGTGATSAEEALENLGVNAALDTKMDKENPVGTGSFSLNRKANKTVGNYSFAVGYDAVASGEYSFAAGEETTASGQHSFAFGDNCKASEEQSFAVGFSTTASGKQSFAEGSSTFATGQASHAEGWNTKANGHFSHSEGYITYANGDYSHAEGEQTKASSDHQHVQGKYNIEDTLNKYAHIVGNGGYNHPSNAHTLDWNGNAWFAGDVYVGGTSQVDTSAKKLSDMLDSKVDKEEGYSLVANTEIERLAEIGTMLSAGTNGEFAVSDGNGGIEWIKEEAITLDEIKLLFDDSIGMFTCEGNTYTFEIGMTWEEFFASEYNIDNTFSASGTEVHYNSGNGNGCVGITENPSVSIKINEEIIENATYILNGEK